MSDRVCMRGGSNPKNDGPVTECFGPNVLIELQKFSICFMQFSLHYVKPIIKCKIIFWNGFFEKMYMTL